MPEPQGATSGSPPVANDLTQRVRVRPAGDLSRLWAQSGQGNTDLGGKETSGQAPSPLRCPTPSSPGGPGPALLSHSPGSVPGSWGAGSPPPRPGPSSGSRAVQGSLPRSSGGRPSAHPETPQVALLKGSSQGRGPRPPEQARALSPARVSVPCTTGAVQALRFHRVSTEDGARSPYPHGWTGLASTPRPGVSPQGD